jgi:hypothetical protein
MKYVNISGFLDVKRDGISSLRKFKGFRGVGKEVGYRSL